VDEPVNGSKVLNGLNHIAILVDDLSSVERRVRKHGFKPHHHGDYEPGYRFYFNDDDGVEYEVVSYVSGFTKALSEIARAGIARH